MNLKWKEMNVFIGIAKLGLITALKAIIKQQIADAIARAHLEDMMRQIDYKDTLVSV
jgi:hypothetical protein